MATNMLRCQHCGRIAPAGTRYCPFCGEAVDPALIAELQWLYGALNDLDTRIARGGGEHSILSLRDEYRTRYLAERRAPVAEKPITAPLPVATAAPSMAASSAAQPFAQPVAQQAAPATPAAPVALAPPVAQRPPGPVFSWQAFLSEQAIAIMMYMGGFLGLVAVLSFEIGGWQSLALGIKLGAVILVYLAFGILGLAMRRLPRLHTVGGAYLGVFALMTPLLALGIYRFGLQAAGFSGAAMLSLSSAYAAIVYLALAWRTRFVSYAYLGWSALVLAALAAVFWANAPREALVFALAAASLALLLPGLLHRLPLAAELETPALQLAAVTSLAAAVGALYIWLILAIRSISATPLAISATPPPPLSTVVYALATVTLALVACGWSYLARRLTGSLEPPLRDGLLNVIDWSIVAAATQAAIALAASAGADRRAMAIVLAGLALVEVGVLFMLWRRAHERAELRYLIEALALALAVGGCLGAITDPPPNWPYLLALTTGVAVTAGLALFEAAPLWLLPAGVFLSLDYHALLDALAAPSGSNAPTFWAFATAALVAGLVVPWLISVAPPRLPRLRLFAAPVLLVAFGNALYSTIDLFGLVAVHATLILGIYVILALLAGWRLRSPLIGGLVAGFFGLLLPFPLAFSVTSTGFVVAACALVTALLALGLRWLMGRAVAIPAYLILLWVALVCSVRVIVNSNIPAGWSLLGLSLGAWLLLALALLMTLATLWDNAPWLLFIPALFAFVAAVITFDLPGVVLTAALVAAGMALRWWRGRWWWSISWYIAALLASLVQVAIYIVRAHQPSGVPNEPVYIALIFAGIVYLAAMVERQPWLTAATPVYVALAAAAVSGKNTFAVTLVITYGAVLAGLALRLRFGRRWAIAYYVSAVVPSLFALLRATPPHAGVVEALLLIFAVTAYGIALVERSPLAGLAAATYAGLATSVQLDAHALLPLALALAAIGIAIGRLGGWRWSWPAYTTALIAALGTAFFGHGSPGFEGWALLALAVVAYLIAVIESQAEILALALFLGVVALVAGVTALGWVDWQVALAFITLSWLYTAGQWLWGALPWLRARPGIVQWSDPETPLGDHSRWQDMRRLGRMMHHGAGLLVGGGVVLTVMLVTDTFTPQTTMAQIEAVALLSLAAMVALSARTIPLHLLWYVAGGLLALGISWEVRWLGADNIQAFVLAPASYLLVIGALLPSDHRLRDAARAGQIASLLGALLLLLPTLTQSFTTALSENWIYASILAVEALIIAAIGVGTHTRALILLGTGFFGLAAIRGALLAFSSGVPVALIIAALAVLLMGSATWLSLRVRREPDAPQF